MQPVCGCRLDTAADRLELRFDSGCKLSSFGRPIQANQAIDTNLAEVCGRVDALELEQRATAWQHRRECLAVVASTCRIAREVALRPCDQLEEPLALEHGGCACAQTF